MSGEQVGVRQQPVTGMADQHERTVEQQLRADRGEEKVRRSALFAGEGGEGGSEQDRRGEEVRQGREVPASGEVTRDREHPGEGGQQRATCASKGAGSRIHRIGPSCCRSGFTDALDSR